MHEPGDYVRALGGVRVFQWNPARRAGGQTEVPLGNFGDLLGPLIVERMLWRRRSLQQTHEAVESRLFAVGSTLHFAKDGDVVWGSGVNGKELPTPLSQWPKLDLRAVRGPWTARLLAHAGLRVPAVFGDPALLVARLFPELAGWTRSKNNDTLVVPNFNDMTSYQNTAHEVLAPTEPLWTVLRAVARSRFVIGSSLHAVVVADALGVPARFVASEHEDPFKYRDYLAGTGRETTRIAKSIQHALDLGPHRPPDVDLDALERTFPWDLWGIDAGEEGDSAPDFEPDVMQSAWLERIESGAGSREVVRHLVEDLVPKINQAAEQDSPELAPLVSLAHDYRIQVAPEVETDRLDHNWRPVVEAIASGDTALVRHAVLLRDSPSLAMLREVRSVGTRLIISVAVHYARTLATATSVELVLTGRGTRRMLRYPVTLFEIQRAQWHVDFDVMVEAAMLVGDDSWELAVEVDGPDPVLLDIVAAPPEALGLLALELGELPTSAPPATLTAAGLVAAGEVNAA